MTVDKHTDEVDRSNGTDDAGAIGQVVVAICWIATLLIAVFSAFNYVQMSGIAESAPQQAAAAAMAAATVIIPYVFTRSVEGLVRGVK